MTTSSKRDGYIIMQTIKPIPEDTEWHIWFCQMAVTTSSTQNCKTVSQTSNVYATHISLCHSEI
jgi:hypothetical protein